MDGARNQVGTNGRRAAIALIVALVIVACPVSAQRQANAAIDSTVLRLAVDDSATGRPISGARIELFSLSAIRRSDDLGRAAFRAVRIGYQRIRVSAIGYQPVNRIIAVSAASAGDSTATLIDLEPTAQLLDTMTTSSRRRLSRTAKLDGGGFDMRRKMGIGHFLDADLIDAEAWRSSLGEMVAEHVVGMRNCGNVCTTRGREQGFLSGKANGPCMLDVYVDGVHQSDKFKLDDVDPEAVAGMEVYTMTEVPPQFKASSNDFSSGKAECGVLVLWTRH